MTNSKIYNHQQKSNLLLFYIQNIIVIYKVVSNDKDHTYIDGDIDIAAQVDKK